MPDRRLLQAVPLHLAHLKLRHQICQLTSPPPGIYASGCKGLENGNEPKNIDSGLQANMLLMTHPPHMQFIQTVLKLEAWRRVSLASPIRPRLGP